MEAFTIHTDGGARGNPGSAAYAFVLSRPGQPDVEENGYLGETTNNVAEYTAVIRALERAKALGGRRVHLKSDSELMVKQMNGLYKVKNEGLKPLYEQARGLTRDFDQVTFQHVYREQNSRADALCNEALDHRGSTRGDSSAATKPKAAKAKPTVAESEGQGDARAEAIAVLRSAFQAWRGEGSTFTFDQLWRDLLTLLGKHGMLKKTGAD